MRPFASSSSRPAILLLIASNLLALLPSSSASRLDTQSAARRAALEERGEVLGSATSPRRRASAGYNDPTSNGGYMLTIVNGTYPAGLGEPLNVILSANSDKDVLVKSTDNGGFLNYMLSTQLGEECLGQHLGSDQEANLGDGQGNVTEIEELRWNYGNPYVGTCEETFNGGLHLRYWTQNTTGAYFLAVSVEKDLAAGHDIVVDGYNIGRDYLVGNLTGTTVPSRNVTNQTTYSGSTTYNNYTYQTDVQYVSGLLQNTSDGINHYLTVQTSQYPAIDGLVAVLTVKITSRPKTSSAIARLADVPALALVTPLVLGGIMSLI
ncbi:hypothetical protein JCM24511_01828 [Saitozyma sp. JCM 24511]|nr:hypothetical protein JCM24511_01828 [Saitozyma sp. JCM 24511]